MRWILMLLASFFVGARPATAFAWGDEGHQIVALIALHYLPPERRKDLEAQFVGDKTHLTADTSIVSEATWADRYRDSDRMGSHQHYNQTRNWHFADIEIDNPDVDAACFGRLDQPLQGLASEGPAQDCVINKVTEFTAEIDDMDVSESEARTALQFLLHLVGDLHQPLHVADDHDQGGNAKQIRIPGRQPMKLHALWDKVLVEKLGRDPQAVADALIAKLTPKQRDTWSKGSPEQWAVESFDIGKREIYRRLGDADAAGTFTLSEAELEHAVAVAGEQLSKAGVRLAAILGAP